MVDELNPHDAELIARDGPDAMTSDRELRRTAIAMEQHARYVAHALADYRERVGLDRDGLEQWLGVGPDQFAALAIEARPDPSSPAFVDAVAALTRRFGADPGRLAEALG